LKAKYYDLNDCVTAYKAAKTDRERSEIFDAILAHLTHHTNAMMNIIKDTKRHADKKISKIMLYNMKRTVSIRDNAEAIYFFQTMSSDMSVEDVKQMIYLEILTIMASYKYSKITFLQYITFLLPIRIASKLVKKSKDVMNQFNIQMEPAIEDEENSKNVILDYSEDDKESMAALSEFLSEADLLFLEDTAKGESDEYMAKRYHMSYKELRHYKKAIKYRVRNFIVNR
jgi:hypothetical protein